MAARLSGMTRRFAVYPLKEERYALTSLDLGELTSDAFLIFMAYLHCDPEGGGHLTAFIKARLHLM